MSNNPPAKLVGLTQEQFDFLLRNCDVNIQYGLSQLQALSSRDLQETMVYNIEMFKTIKQALNRAE